MLREAAHFFLHFFFRSFFFLHASWLVQAQPFCLWHRCWHSNVKTALRHGGGDGGGGEGGGGEGGGEGGGGEGGGGEGGGEGGGGGAFRKRIHEAPRPLPPSSSPGAPTARSTTLSPSTSPRAATEAPNWSLSSSVPVKLPDVSDSLA